MRYIRRGNVAPVLAALLILFTLSHPRDAHAAIDRDPYGLEKADKIAPGWMEARMKTYLADLWFERGEQYSNGTIVKQNHEAAFKWYEKAAHLDHPEALFDLGIAYHCGQGVEANIHLAATWFQSAADLGHVRAHHSLGHLYSDTNDDGLAQDVDKAHELWRRAGEIGRPSLGLENHLENPHNVQCE
ncbi:MAG: sel1 repeat family protein [Rhodobiaceae bacterium]|nr:sel1 repeat family protein [Rhodobiaceae bacterium]